jgi:hypothetical protein
VVSKVGLTQRGGRVLMVEKESADYILEMELLSHIQKGLKVNG